MNLSMLLLKAMKYRDKYDKFKTIINSDVFITDYTRRILKLYGEYFEESGADVIDFDTFVPWCEASHKLNSFEFKSALEDYVEEAQIDLPEDIDKALYNRVAKEAYILKIGEVVSSYKKGEVCDPFSEIEGHIYELRETIQRDNLLLPVEESIEELLMEEENDSGFKWRLDEINRSMRPLRGGDFGVLAARPDTGKTSFIADQLTYFAKQLNEGEKIIWLNNEGPGRRIKQRIYQASLNATIPELQTMLNGKELHSRFYETNSQQIFVYDIHDYYSHDIEKLIEKEKPKIVVFDMIDNVKFVGHNHLGGTRTDQILETMYQWARGLGVKHDCAMLATSQVSQDGEGLKFPTLGMLKDSKTGKQGACDFVMMIGCEDKNSDRRYISTPKNKLTVSTGKVSPNCEVYFDLHRSRYNPQPAHQEIVVETDYGIDKEWL